MRQSAAVKAKTLIKSAFLIPMQKQNILKYCQDVRELHVCIAAKDEVQRTQIIRKLYAYRRH
jgi:hypothetical protein